MPDFPFVNLALTTDGFATYLKTYDFGKVPPDFVVFHHTVDPATSWATGGLPSKKWWDRNEQSLSPVQIKYKRLRQMGVLKNYYQNTLGWSAGPHLFIDERYIYLMTPMSDIGIHAKWGNSFKREGKLHYSVGIEVVGNYEEVRWPVAVQANVRAAVQALHQRLGTFDLSYMYADGEKPGMVIVDGEQRCARPELLRWGGLSSHRDYNKPGCPGRAITEDFYTQVVGGALVIDPPATATKITQMATGAAGGAYVVKSGVKATVRSTPERPSDRSNIVEEIPAGKPVQVVAIRSGQAVDGNPDWAQLGPGRYVHMSALREAGR